MINIPSQSGLPPQSVPEQRLSRKETEGRGAASAAPTVPEQTTQNGRPSTRTKSAPPQPSAEELQRFTEELQKRVNGVAPELQFSVDESSGRSIIKITDRTTKEIIRQIPSEEVLQINKELDRFQQGLLLNRKA